MPRDQRGRLVIDGIRFLSRLLKGTRPDRTGIANRVEEPL